MNRQNPRKIRHNRIRAKVFGTAERPRLSVFRSNKHIYVQLINDSLAKTLAAASSDKVKEGKLMAKAMEVGKVLAKEAISKGFKKAVFDRGGFRYAGKIKAVAEGARAGGLIF